MQFRLQSIMTVKLFPSDGLPRLPLTYPSKVKAS
ncbi:MAG: hypothetical protein QOG66_882 [Methylobacteriaceae bacterium]|jgi:hypothetical protein|nr:hypothetical protein [Methylobacteriaceae bacterium]